MAGCQTSLSTVTTDDSESDFETAVGLDAFDAARLLCNMADEKDHCRQGRRLTVRQAASTFRLGLIQRQEVRLAAGYTAAVRSFLRSKRTKRPRTLRECRQVFHRLSAVLPFPADTPLGELRTQDCRRLIAAAYPTPSGRNKARALLRSLFNYARKRGWCRGNPIRKVPPERLTEHELTALSLPQITRLTDTLSSPAFAACDAAVSLMLWAGIRPTEVTRLCWRDIDLAERTIHLKAAQTKTGGGRPVRIQEVLYRRLTAYRQAFACTEDTPLIPPNWGRLWKRLRDAAGLKKWRGDTLRHTFASYHLKYFDDWSRLQQEMGHRSGRMLRMHYLNLRGITAAAAALFWELPPRETKRKARR